MSAEFHKFPSTPHLAWLGQEPVREDKVFSQSEIEAFLASEIIVEEKIDGANLGISIDSSGELHFQNRGNYLTGTLRGQWKPLRGWAASHLPNLLNHLTPGLILFGEWCYATHSIAYNRLPDWFIAFDVFDARSSTFWSTSRRDQLLAKLGIPPVPQVFEGRTTLSSLTPLASQPSAFATTPREGIYLRSETEDCLVKRAKLVNPNFTQSIGEHWSRGALRANQLAPSPRAK